MELCLATGRWKSWTGAVRPYRIQAYHICSCHPHDQACEQGWSALALVREGVTAARQAQTLISTASVRLPEATHPPAWKGSPAQRLRYLLVHPQGTESEGCVHMESIKKGEIPDLGPFL